MILVVGSTGVLGGEICRRLIAKGKSVAGLVRTTSDPAKVEQLKALGVQIITGDLRDLASLTKACRGVQTVVSTATTTASMQPGDSIPATDQQGNLNLVQAARSSGVKDFIFVSYSKNVDANTIPCPLTVAKRSVEQAVIDSGMAYTILRPSYFMEAWLGPVAGYDPVNAKATVFGDGLARLSYIAMGDVAQFAVESMDNPAARNAIFELGGPQAITQLDAVKIFEKVSGKPFDVQHVPIEALQAQKEAATNPLEASFAVLMLNAVLGDEVDTGPAGKAFSFPLTSVEDYVRQVVAK